MTFSLAIFIKTQSLFQIMNQKYLLQVEIKAFEFTQDDLDKRPTIFILCDRQDNCYIATGIKEIKTAIIGAIPHLGSNYRHPLLFDVQILPGEEMDAYLTSVKNRRFRKNRVRKTGNN